MIRGIGQIGEYLIQSIKDGKVIKEELLFNRITDAGLNEWADALVGTASDIEIKFLALGTDDTAIQDTDIQLYAEVIRIADTALAKVSIGQSQAEFTLLDSEALVHIKEIGIFCGTGATGSANTGLMLSRILWDSDRTSGATEVKFIRIDTFERK
jgi:hypothetical protein